MDRPLVRQGDRKGGRGQLAGAVLAGAVNLGMVAAFLFAVQVAPAIKPAPLLTIGIEKHVQPPPPTLTIVPMLRAPQALSAAAPQFTIQPDAPSAAGPAPAAAPASASAGAAAAPAGTAGIIDPAYLALIRSHLLKVLVESGLGKDDPASGVAVLRFIIDRSGDVLSFAIVQSSGHASLDTDTLILIQKASPLPPMPATMTGDHLAVIIPVSFPKKPAAVPDNIFTRNLGR